ncbi:MAG: site-specific integrase [Flavobacteriia bacterium]|nr:site-specific integrase [Flavobacteriia bacterium]
MSNKEKAYFIQKKANKTQPSTAEQYDSFKSYLQSKNIWFTTIEDYTDRVEKVAKWLQENKSKSLEQAEKKDILDYLQYLNETLNYAVRSRQQVVGILKHYYTFLYQNGEIANNPILLIKLRGTSQRTINKLLSMEEMNELLDTYYNLKVQHAKQGGTDNLGRFKTGKHYHQRNYLILSLCIYQGLNLSEWKSLTLDDINLQQATIKVQARRKSNARTLPLHAMQIGILYEYLHSTRSQFKNDNELLINSNPEVQKLALEIKKIYPKFTDYKQLRASIITYWIQTEGLRKAQYKAGHRYISSTEEYLWGDLESLKNDINTFHPL